MIYKKGTILKVVLGIKKQDIAYIQILEDVIHQQQDFAGKVLYTNNKSIFETHCIDEIGMRSLEYLSFMKHIEIVDMGMNKQAIKLLFVDNV